MVMPYIRSNVRAMSKFFKAADQTREDLYCGGEEPRVGDIVEVVPEEGSNTPEHEVLEGERYEVVEVDGGYIFFDDDYGWWPTRFVLIYRVTECSSCGSRFHNETGYGYSHCCDHKEVICIDRNGL